MSELEKEILYDIFEEAGYEVSLPKSNVIKAVKQNGNYFRVFIEPRWIDCVKTEPEHIYAANRLSYSDLLEYIHCLLERA